MSRKSVWRRAIVVMMCSLIVACSAVVRKDAPTIAHVHIGHAITAWEDAPKSQGLLVSAELFSVSATVNSELLLQATRNRDMAKSRKYLKAIAMDVDPAYFDEELDDEYGLRRATAEATTHLKLASDVFDATPNVQRTVTRTNIKAKEIIDRADELSAFLEVGLATESVEELEIIAEEIALLVNTIAGGPDNDADYGLYNFREDIEAMVAREDPPYETVDSYYLFNLVKLPDGQWGFGSRRSRGAAGAGY